VIVIKRQFTLKTVKYKIKKHYEIWSKITEPQVVNLYTKYLYSQSDNGR